MYQKILCPVDGSPTSDCGMYEAIRLANDQKAKLRFLHVVDTYFPMMDFSADLNVIYVADMLRENGKKVIKKAELAAHQSGTKIESKTVEVFGNKVAECIADEAEKWSADLIVMGMHGLRGIQRLVMGSDAETVTRTSHVPVLLVRDQHESETKS